MTQKEIKIKVPGHSDRNNTMQFEDISYDVKTKGNIFKLGLAMPLDEEKDDEAENLARCHAKAKSVSEKERCVQHINKRSSEKDRDGHTQPGAGKHYVSDWYDSDETVASYNNGRLRESTELEESEKLADVTKIDTKTLRHITHLHRTSAEREKDADQKARILATAKRGDDELRKRGEFVPTCEEHDFEHSISARGTGVKQKQFTGAKMVKGKGEYARINTPAAKTVSKSFTFPELKGVFAQLAPKIDAKATTIKGRDMVDDEDDATVAKPVAPEVGEAERIHAQLHGASRAVIGINHIKAALAKGMQGINIVAMSRSPVGRKQLRSLGESFSDVWMINVIKENNIFTFKVMDGEDVLAEGVNITMNGACKLAYEKAEALEEHITEQAIVMLEKKELEEGKISRVLDIAKSVAK